MRAWPDHPGRRQVLPAARTYDTWIEAYRHARWIAALSIVGTRWRVRHAHGAWIAEPIPGDHS
jgi:hypothetical protein